MLLEVLRTLDDLLVQPRLEVVQLLDLLLVDLDDRLHLLDLALILELRGLGHRQRFLDLLVLQLYVGGLGGILPLQQEIMILYLFLHGGHVALDLVDLDGLLGLLLVEGLQQVDHDLPHLGLHLVPLELLDLYALLLLTHLILFIN